MPFPPLAYGGVIATYQCQAACGHCLYGCSPDYDPSYISDATSDEVFPLLRKMGCGSLHIGGGEPFLDVEGLVRLIRKIIGHGISIDYIETNAGWVGDDPEKNREVLRRIRQTGEHYIMVSADPFHSEFIPFGKVLSLLRLLREEGTPYFVFQQRYMSILSRLDPDKTYDRESMKKALNEDVAGDSAREYGMRYNGRALGLLRQMAEKQDAGSFLGRGPCLEWKRTDHFHIDLLGRYVPPGCTGMGIKLADMSAELDPADYPVISRLMKKGLNALWELALEKGYTPEEGGYVSKCDACFKARQYLIKNDPLACPDLSPKEFYYQNY